MSPEQAILLANKIDYELLVGTLILLLSILLHEIGHTVRLWELNNKKPITIRLKMTDPLKWQLMTGTSSDYDNLSLKELNSVYVSGIILGVVPIIIGWLGGTWASLVVSVMYVIGISSDVNKIFKNKVIINKESALNQVEKDNKLI